LAALKASSAEEGLAVDRSMGKKARFTKLSCRVVSEVRSLIVATHTGNAGKMTV